MKRLVLGFALATLVTAKPELYKEKEDFQYSRSSSDEGTKSGYYDAQRGNMGGNYERAHNMDTLAQHQMGGLVRQVDGELGDGSKTRTGSVFSSANTRGVYGSGKYDLSNLQGRNFQEGVSYDNSHLHSETKNAHDAYTLSNAWSGSRGTYDTADYRGYQRNNLQDTQNMYGSNQFEQGAHLGSSSRHSSQSRYQDRNTYSQSHVNTDEVAENVNSNAQHRLISTLPVKIIVRPGQRIAIPIATQTYHDAHLTAVQDHSVANSEAEVLNSDGVQEYIKPIGAGKHYESSYSYHKEWEKHNNNPGVVFTTNPVVKSGAYESDRLNYGSQYSDNEYEHSRDQNTAFSHSRYESDFNAHHQNSASSNSISNAFSQVGSKSDINSHSGNLVGVISSKPKSYQSSFSYHKSWERQGDPYIIKPATNGVYEGQSSEKLTDASHTQYNCMYECKSGHIRVARSHNTDNTQMEQQSQNLEDFNQQTQWNNLENLGQQIQGTWGQSVNSEQDIQSNWKDHGQQTQNLEDFSHQSQDNRGQRENFGLKTQNKFDNLEDLGQQTQTVWDKVVDGEQHPQDLNNFGQQSHSKLEDLENLDQQTQNTFNNIENFGKETQSQWGVENTGHQSESQLHAHEQQSETQDKWGQNEYSGQQTQNKWDNFEHLGQQTNGMWSNFENHGQQTQSIWDKVEGGQQTQHLNDFGQQSQSKLDDLENLSQQTQNTFNNVASFGKEALSKWDLQNTGYQQESQLHAHEQQSETQDKWGQNEYSGQQTQNKWDNFEHLGQQTNGMWSNFENHGQKTQSMWDKVERGQQTQDFNHFGQQSESKLDDLENLGQQTQNTFNNIENFGKETQSQWGVENTGHQSESQLHAHELQSETQDKWGQNEYSGQQTQNKWDNFENLGQQTNGMWSNFENHGQQTQSMWDKVEGEQQTQNLNDFGQQLETQNQWNIGQQSETQSNLDTTSKQTELTAENFNQKYHGQQIEDTWEKLDKAFQTPIIDSEENQHTQQKWNPIENLDMDKTDKYVNNQNKVEKVDIHNTLVSEKTHSIWDKIENLEPNNQTIQQHEIEGKTPHVVNKEQPVGIWDIITKTDNSSHKVGQEPKINHTILQNNSGNNLHTTGALGGLWGKIEKLDDHSTVYSHSSSSQLSKWHEEKFYKHLTSDLNNKNNLDSHVSKIVRSNIAVQSELTTEKINQPMVRPVDIGRGDIEPEDVKIENTENITNYDNKNNGISTIKHELNNEVTKNEFHTYDVIVENQTSQTHPADFNKQSNIDIQDQQSENKKNVEIFNGFEQQNTAGQISNWDVNENDQQSYNEHNTKLFNHFDQQSTMDQQSNWDVEQSQNQEFSQQNIQGFNTYEKFGNVEKQSKWNIQKQENNGFNQQNVEPTTMFEQKSNWDVEQQKTHSDEFEQHLVSGGPDSEQKKSELDFGEFIPEPNNINKSTKNEDDIELIEKKVYHPIYTGLEINEMYTSTLAPTTAKPGFWKSVGKKVKSWFGR